MVLFPVCTHLCRWRGEVVAPAGVSTQRPLQSQCRLSSEKPNITYPPFLSWLYQPPHQFYSLYLRNRITLIRIDLPSLISEMECGNVLPSRRFTATVIMTKSATSFCQKSQIFSVKASKETILLSLISFLKIRDSTTV